jgi:hypothetical protein
MELAGSISQPIFAWPATSLRRWQPRRTRMLLWPQERSADLPRTSRVLGGGGGMSIRMITDAHITDA